MIYFPETINTVSTWIYTLPMHSLLSSSWAQQLTLCMLASQSREGVVFLVLLPSSHLTVYHVLSLFLSGLNWCSLFPPLGPFPPFRKMASLFTGSAHTPFPGSTTLTATGCIVINFWPYSGTGHRVHKKISNININLWLIHWLSWGLEGVIKHWPRTS